MQTASKKKTAAPIEKGKGGGSSKKADIKAKTPTYTKKLPPTYTKKLPPQTYTKKLPPSSGGGGTSSSGGGGGSSGGSSGGGGGGSGYGGGRIGQPRVLAPNTADTPYHDAVEPAKAWSHPASAKPTTNAPLAAVRPGVSPTVAPPATGNLMPLTPAKAAVASKLAATAKPTVAPTATRAPLKGTLPGVTKGPASGKPNWGNPGTAAPGQPGLIKAPYKPPPMPRQNTLLPSAPKAPLTKPGYVSGGPGVYQPNGPLSSAKPLAMPKPLVQPAPRPRPSAPGPMPPGSTSSTVTHKGGGSTVSFDAPEPRPSAPPPRPSNPGGLQPGGWTPPRDMSSEGISATVGGQSRYASGRGFRR